jgi:receptor protein-tyrosine kinase
MFRVKSDSPLSVIARRKWVIIVTAALLTVTTAIVSKTLDKVYETQATLLVALPTDRASFDSVQASQAIARSYADIIKSPNIAQLVSNRLGAGYSRHEVATATSFEPVPQTQLLTVTTEAPSPQRAKAIADAYAVVFIQYARANLARTTGASISLADAAPLKRTAARPKPLLYTLSAAVIGLALGLALAFLLDRVDRRLRTFEDVEAQFDVPILARVPRWGRSEVSVNAFKEAMRILRTNLQFAGHDGPLKSIAITSARDGEGKTMTVANLAIASAEVGLNAVVVEADMRRPALQRQMLPDQPTPLRPGFSNYLVEAAPLDHCIFPAGKPGVDIVPSGPLPPSPSALLESRRGDSIVSELTERFDLVLFDCPPLTIGADASIMSGWVDGVIVVVDLQSSSDQSLRQALRQLAAVKAPVIGLLINRDRDAASTRYDYYSTVTPDLQPSGVGGNGARG